MLLCPHGGNVVCCCLLTVCMVGTLYVAVSAWWERCMLLYVAVSAWCERCMLLYVDSLRGGNVVCCCLLTVCVVVRTLYVAVC